MRVKINQDKPVRYTDLLCHRYYHSYVKSLSIIAMTYQSPGECQLAASSRRRTEGRSCLGGSLWMGVYECIWVCMGVYGCIWVYMSVYECIWVCKGV